MNLAIVGATGLVGSTFLKVLGEKPEINIDKLFLFASAKSAGKQIVFKNKKYIVEELCEKNIIGKHIDYALFSAGGKVSKKFAPIFAQNGCIVIDNSSAWRMEKSVPLVVPEVNHKDLKNHNNIIANPNCSTIQCMAPLSIIDNLFGLKSVHYVTFQAVSGSGIKGIKDLELSMDGKKCEFYPHQIYNNCLPHIDTFFDDGFTKEEHKMVDETQKILHLPNLPISATCVRVPVFNSHSIAIEAECEKDIDIKKLIAKFKTAKTIKVLNNNEKNIYPLATLATGQDKILVGRIRKDLFSTKKVHLFCVADNIRKGAASNAVEILNCFLD